MTEFATGEIAAFAFDATIRNHRVQQGVTVTPSMARQDASKNNSRPWATVNVGYSYPGINDGIATVEAVRQEIRYQAGQYGGQLTKSEEPGIQDKKTVKARDWFQFL